MVMLEYVGIINRFVNSFDYRIFCFFSSYEDGYYDQSGL